MFFAEQKLSAYVFSSYAHFVVLPTNTVVLLLLLLVSRRARSRRYDEELTKRDQDGGSHWALARIPVFPRP